VDAPALLGPLDGSVTTGTSDPPVGVPLLAWTAPAGAVRYQVQVSTSSGFASTVVAQETYATSYAPVAALADGDYYWRVRAFDGEEWGPYSEPWMFAKDWCAGGALAPQLLTPSEGAVHAAFTPEEFTWEPVSGAATYRFEISLDPDFPSPRYTSATAYTPGKGQSLADGSGIGGWRSWTPTGKSGATHCRRISVSSTRW